MHRRVAFLAVAVLAGLALAPLATSSASYTSASSNTASVSSAADWTPPQVALASPGDAIRGTVNLTVTATDGESGIDRVVVAWAPSGTTTFTTICTRTVAPYGCSFATTGLGEIDIDLRAIAYDKAGYTATSLVEGVVVDNVAPSVALADPGSPLRGSVTILANASDAGSGVAQVTIQHAPAGTTAWTTLCVRTVAPYSCRWDTTTVVDASYDLRAIAVDAAGNNTTSGSLRRSVDNTVSAITIEDPGEPITGTIVLTAFPSSTAGIASVRIQRSVPGVANGWTDVCTLTVAPWSCSWNSTTVTDGSYSFRAILVDGAAKTTTSAVVGPRLVDNSPVRGVDVQTTNNGIVGKIDANDVLTLIYSDPMRSTSFLAGWDGTARQVVVRVRDGNLLGRGASGDTLDVFTTTNFSTPVQVGSINLNGNFNGKNTNAFNATMVHATVTRNGVATSAISFTMGSQVVGKAGNNKTVTVAGSLAWSPSASALSTLGTACSTVLATETGALDVDF